jgi:hypothetical protein
MMLSQCVLNSLCKNSFCCGWRFISCGIDTIIRLIEFGDIVGGNRCKVANLFFVGSVFNAAYAWGKGSEIT